MEFGITFESIDESPSYLALSIRAWIQTIVPSLVT